MARGLSLIEILITTAILMTGLVAVVSIFAYSASTNLHNQQRTAAAALLYDKMEQLRTMPIANTACAAGGNLNPESPAIGYFDYVSIAATATLISSTTDRSLPYMRVWQIADCDPRLLTVVVYARNAGLTRRRSELIRATTLVSTSF